MKKSDSTPTYLYDFLHSIAPLREENAPAPLVYERGTLVYGYTDRATAEKYVKDLPPEGEYFQLYASASEPDTLHYTDVTQQVAYMDSIKVEDFTVTRAHSGRIRFYAAIFEGIVLFDLLDALSNKNLFAVAGGLPYLSAVFTNNSVEDLSDFIECSANPLDIDVFIAQVRFFFAKYFECVFSNTQTRMLSEAGYGDFDDRLCEQVERYKRYVGWKVESVTGIENRPFNLFTLQLEALIQESPDEFPDRGVNVRVNEDRSIKLPSEYCEALKIKGGSFVEAQLSKCGDTVLIREARCPFCGSTENLDEEHQVCESCRRELSQLDIGAE